MNNMSDDAREGQMNEGASKETIRINKFLSLCGIESRRAADRLIEEGRVEVNGETIMAPGMQVGPNDFVKVDGSRVQPKAEETILLNKPRGFVCSRDAQGAIGTVYDLLSPRHRHLNYVGRLDADSEGLIIMTNNGDLIQKLTHPSNGLEKEYWVTLDQNFDNSSLMQLVKGVRIPEGQAKAKYVCRSSARRACVVLEQGMKRQIRQMFSCMGLRVKKLVRVRIGSLWGGDLNPGSYRLMDAQDIEAALKNPPRQRKFLGTRELEAYKVMNRKAGSTPRPEEKDDDSYEFNPDDFEVDLNEGTYELEDGMQTRFSDKEPVDDRRSSREDRFAGDRRGGAGFGRGRREGGFGGGQRREGGFGGRREGGFGGGQRREGGFRREDGPRREGGFRREDGPRREGGFGGRREGGFGGGQRREGGFRREDGPRREGGFGGRREGGFGGGQRREGGFRREDGPRREGSFGGPREGGFGGGQRREGGFRREDGPRREGGFGGRREGGFGGGQRREGGFRREDGPRREGGFGGRREGGFGGGQRREDGPRREGGFGGGQRREGGFGGGQRREGGPRREGGFRREDGPRREGGNRY